LRNKIITAFGGKPHIISESEEENAEGHSRQGISKMIEKYSRHEKHQVSQILSTPQPKRRNVAPAPITSDEEGYNADEEQRVETSRESSPSTNPFLITPSKTILRSLKVKSPKLARSLEDGIRFCIFNTGHINKREFWSIIRERLTPETLSGIQRVQNVIQPNGRKRMDMWVAARVATKLKSAMYLTATARREGVNTSFKFPMRELEGMWKPNSNTRHWRVDVYRRWREREISPKP